MKPLLLVDGYNVIGAWSVPREEHLSIEQARERLVHLIADYAGYSGEEVIVVFDGHYTDRPTRSRTMMHGVERISSREFLIEITQTRQTGRVRMREEKVSRGDIFSRLPPHQREIFERMRRGEE